MQSAPPETGNRRRARGAGAGLCTTLALLAAAGPGAQTAAGARAATGAQTATSAVSPLPRSDYRVSDVCFTPGPRHVGCLAQELVPETAAARARLHPIGIARTRPLTVASAAGGSYGLRPEDLKGAYFPGEPAENAESEGQTIALVDVYNDLYAEPDLGTYGKAFETKLPTLAKCGAGVTKNCFEKVNQKGEAGESTLPFPHNAKALEEEEASCKTGRESSCLLVEEATGWSVETSLDIEIAHAVCQNCRIVLVEAESPKDENLEEAEDAAAKTMGATEISNSWGGEEPPTDSAAFDHPETVITASAGDSGYLNWTDAALGAPYYYTSASYPASSPHVVAVGGTSLKLDGETGAWEGETVWNDAYGAGGGGCSTYFEPQTWQLSLPDWSAVGCAGKRAVADVSADADPYTGVAVYDSESNSSCKPWCTLGGTSLSSPLIAAMFALSGGAHGVAYPAQTLYEHLETGLLHTVSGSNGECDGEYSSGCTGSMESFSPRFAFDCGQGVLVCNSAAGCEGHFYAGPAGVGTPNGIGAFDPEEHPAKEAKACEGSSGGTSEGGETGVSSGESTSFAGASAPATATALAPGSTGSGSTAQSPSTTASAPIPVISNLMLARIARVAPKRRHAPPAAWRIAFAFTASVATRVQVRLERRRVVRGHVRWRTLRGGLTIEAMPGPNSAHLRVRRRLGHGRYRLTLIPSGGSAGMLAFRI